MDNINIYDDELTILREKVDRKHKLERELDGMLIQAGSLDKRLEELRRERYREEQDVAELEGRTLTRLWYYITKQADDRLERGKERALAAAAKYDAAKAESVELNMRIGRYRDELVRLSSCENRYEEKLREKQNLIRLNKPEGCEELIALCDKNADDKRILRELDEAISAGEAAESAAVKAIELLESASGFAAWDVFGGGLIADMAKHEKIDSAQEHIESLQVQLRRFKCELSDVDTAVDVSMDAAIDGTLKFADFFFDGLISDIMVANRIEKALESVRSTRSQVSGILKHLYEVRDPFEREYEKDKAKIEEMMLNNK